MSGYVQLYGAKMTVRFVLAWMLLSGLLIVGCGGGSNSQPEIGVNDVVESAVEAVVEAPTATPYAPSMDGTPEVMVSEVPDALTQALKENSALKTLRANLIQELNNRTFSPQKLFVPEENLKALREAKEDMSNTLYGKDPHTEFLKNEINRLLSERKRLENLGLPYDYDFPESGFPIERKAEVLALAEGLRLSVVKVRSGGGEGTGFVIGNDLVLTNEHVISGEGTGYRSGVIDDIIVETFGGVAFLNASMIGYDKLWDVALLRIGDGDDTPFSDIGVPALTFGDSKKLEMGDPLFAIGHPGQMGDWALTAGVSVQSQTTVFTPLRKNYDTDIEFEAALAVLEKLLMTQKRGVGEVFTPTVKEGDPGTKTTVQTTVPGMIGSSGSPIFNVNGEVIALLWGSTSMEIGTNDQDAAFGAGGSFKDPAPHIMHSVPVKVSREWTVGSPAWKIEELITKWLDAKP